MLRVLTIARMWPFRRKPLLDPDTASWHTQNLAWLITTYGSENFRTNKLVVPEPGAFIADGETGHELAERIFDQVKDHAGFSSIAIDLIADDNPLAQRERPSLANVAPKQHAAGTFAISGDRFEITYATALLAQPASLIATFAHELAHILVECAPVAPCCGEDEREFLTDLTAIYLGFGVFIANNRLRYERHDDGLMQGWQMMRAGYLPEADAVYALALFLKARGTDSDKARKYLKPHLAGMLRKALRDLETDPHYADIEQALASAKPYGVEFGAGDG